MGKSAGKREGRQGSAKNLCGNVTDAVGALGKALGRLGGDSFASTSNLLTSNPVSR